MKRQDLKTLEAWLQTAKMQGERLIDIKEAVFGIARFDGVAAAVERTVEQMDSTNVRDRAKTERQYIWRNAVPKRYERIRVLQCYGTNETHKIHGDSLLGVIQDDNRTKIRLKTQKEGFRLLNVTTILDANEVKAVLLALCACIRYLRWCYKNLTSVESSILTETTRAAFEWLGRTSDAEIARDVYMEYMCVVHQTLWEDQEVVVIPEYLKTHIILRKDSYNIPEIRFNHGLGITRYNLAIILLANVKWILRHADTISGSTPDKIILLGNEISKFLTEKQFLRQRFKIHTSISSIPNYEHIQDATGTADERTSRYRPQGNQVETHQCATDPLMDLLHAKGEYAETKGLDIPVGDPKLRVSLGSLESCKKETSFKGQDTEPCAMPVIFENLHQSMSLTEIWEFEFIEPGDRFKVSVSGVKNVCIMNSRAMDGIRAIKQMRLQPRIQAESMQATHQIPGTSRQQKANTDIPNKLLKRAPEAHKTCSQDRSNVEVQQARPLKKTEIIPHHETSGLPCEQKAIENSSIKKKSELEKTNPYRRRDGTSTRKSSSSDANVSEMLQQSKRDVETISIMDMHPVITCTTYETIGLSKQCRNHWEKKTNQAMKRGFYRQLIKNGMQYERQNTHNPDTIIAVEEQDLFEYNNVVSRNWRYMAMRLGNLVREDKEGPEAIVRSQWIRNVIPEIVDFNKIPETPTKCCKTLASLCCTWAHSEWNEGNLLGLPLIEMTNYMALAVLTGPESYMVWLEQMYQLVTIGVESIVNEAFPSECFLDKAVIKEKIPTLASSQCSTAHQQTLMSLIMEHTKRNERNQELLIDTEWLKPYVTAIQGELIHDDGHIVWWTGFMERYHQQNGTSWFLECISKSLEEATHRAITYIKELRRHMSQWIEFSKSYGTQPTILHMLSRPMCDVSCRLEVCIAMFSGIIGVISSQLVESVSPQNQRERNATISTSRPGQCRHGWRDQYVSNTGSDLELSDVHGTASLRARMAWQSVRVMGIRTCGVDLTGELMEMWVRKELYTFMDQTGKYTTYGMPEGHPWRTYTERRVLRVLRGEDRMIAVPTFEFGFLAASLAIMKRCDSKTLINTIAFLAWEFLCEEKSILGMIAPIEDLKYSGMRTPNSRSMTTQYSNQSTQSRGSPKPGLDEKVGIWNQIHMKIEEEKETYRTELDRNHVWVAELRRIYQRSKTAWKESDLHDWALFCIFQFVEALHESMLEMVEVYYSIEQLQSIVMEVCNETTIKDAFLRPDNQCKADIVETICILRYIKLYIFEDI
jgi:hypothetical protein